MCKKEIGMMNLGKEGITKLWIIIFTLGSCWSISKRPNDEKLREVDIMWSKITLNNYEFCLQYFNKYKPQMYHAS